VRRVPEESFTQIGYVHDASLGSHCSPQLYLQAPAPRLSAAALDLASVITLAEELEQVKEQVDDVQVQV